MHNHNKNTVFRSPNIGSGAHYSGFGCKRTKVMLQELSVLSSMISRLWKALSKSHCWPVSADKTTELPQKCVKPRIVSNEQHFRLERIQDMAEVITNLIYKWTEMSGSIENWYIFSELGTAATHILTQKNNKEIQVMCIASLSILVITIPVR